jgi:hypothetical protein
MQEYGAHIKFFLIQRKKGRNTPLDEKPEADEIVNWILNEAFQYLSPLRTEHIGMSGMVKGYIPISEISAYCEVFPLLINRSEFAIIIRNLDQMFLVKWNEEYAKANKGAAKK